MCNFEKFVRFDIFYVLIANGMVVALYFLARLGVPTMRGFLVYFVQQENSLMNPSIGYIKNSVIELLGRVFSSFFCP